MEITQKIAALDTIRDRLEQDLLKLQEDDLELDDERTFKTISFFHIVLSVSEVEGVRERLELEGTSSRTQKTPVRPVHLPQSSRRRKGNKVYRTSYQSLTPDYPRTGVPAVRTRRPSSRSRLYGTIFYLFFSNSTPCSPILFFRLSTATRRLFRPWISPSHMGSLSAHHKKMLNHEYGTSSRVQKSGDYEDIVGR